MLLRSVVWLTMGILLSACASSTAPVRLYGGAPKPASGLVMLDVGPGVQLVEMDGDEVSGSLLRDSYQAELLPGEHVLKVRYSELWQVSAEEHDVVRSSPLLIRFTGSAGQHFRFDYPRPRNRDEARRFAKDPRIALVEVASASRVEAVSLGKAGLDGLGSSYFGQEGGNGLERLKKIWSQTRAEDRKQFVEWLKSPEAAF